MESLMHRSCFRAGAVSLFLLRSFADFAQPSSNAMGPVCLITRIVCKANEEDSYSPVYPGIRREAINEVLWALVWI